MQHQMSTTTKNDEYVLNCTCTPTGTLFIGSKEGCARNMVQHQDQAKAEREHARDRHANCPRCPHCGQHRHASVRAGDCAPATDAEWLYGNSPGGLRMRAAEELAAEFGTDVSEWLV